MELYEKNMCFLTQKRDVHKLKIAKNFDLSPVWLLVFLFWHWGFLQGFLGEAEIKIRKMLVVRCPRELWYIVKKYFCIYGITSCAKLALKAKEFEQVLTGINDDFLFLEADGIDNSCELRAKSNLMKIFEMRHKSGNINEVQKIYPILLISDALPPIGLNDDDYLFLDIEEADFSDGAGLYEKADLLNNRMYVRAITHFLSEHYDSVINQIEREKRLPGRDSTSDAFALEILASVVSYAVVGNNFQPEFAELRNEFLIAISRYREIWEIGINFSDLVEIFRVQAEQGMTKLLSTALPRKKLPDLEVANRPDVVFYDENYFYFMSETIKKCCRGELKWIPFVRILHQLDEAGYLKVTNKRSRDLTTVVNLIQEETGKIKLKRLIGIKRQFFE